MDFTTFFQTYGPWTAIGLMALYLIIKGLADRGASQDKRDIALSEAFDKIITTFQETSRATADSLNHASEVYDRVANRLDANETIIANAFKEAAEQRGEQLVILKTIISQLANPKARFNEVVEEINNPLLAAIKDGTQMVNDATKALVEQVLIELRSSVARIEVAIKDGKVDASTIIDALRSDISRVDAKIDILTSAVHSSVQAAPTQTVTVQLPANVTKKEEPPSEKSGTDPASAPSAPGDQQTKN